MKKIVEYIVVRVHPASSTTKKIEVKVNGLIQKGWQPFGGISITNANVQAQALVKYEN